MIFLSYSRKDINLIDVIAQSLEKVFGKDNIFYDAWSIQPGDSIIGKMDEGLKKCKFFFYFITANSLTREMVKLEWQNALIKSMTGDTKFIPVRVDNMNLPDILIRTLYIDLFTYGLEVAIHQIIDVINGKNTYQPLNQTYQNVIAYLDNLENGNEIIEIRAETYMEPYSRYLILVDNDKEDLSYSAIGESVFESSFKENFVFDNGLKSNLILMARDAPTSPGFPFIFEIKKTKEKDIIIKTIMRIVSRNKFRSIPIFVRK